MAVRNTAVRVSHRLFMDKLSTTDMKLGPAWIPLADPAEPIATATAVRQGEACRHVFRSSRSTLIGASSTETWYAINIGYQDKPCGE
jgi:hypothetical protein